MYIFKTKKSLLAFHIGNNRTNNTFFFSFGYIEYIIKKRRRKRKEENHDDEFFHLSTEDCYFAIFKAADKYFQ
jgi:hypothetical protein